MVQCTPIGSWGKSMLSSADRVAGESLWTVKIDPLEVKPTNTPCMIHCIALPLRAVETNSSLFQPKYHLLSPARLAATSGLFCDCSPRMAEAFLPSCTIHAGRPERGCIHFRLSLPYLGCPLIPSPTRSGSGLSRALAINPLLGHNQAHGAA